MKLLFIPAVAIGALALLPGLIGCFLPASRSATHTLIIATTPESIWTLWTTPSRQPEWRPGLTRVEVHDATPGAERWTEFPERGPALHFATVSQVPFQSWTLRFEGPASGTWTGSLEPLHAGSTRVHLVETTTTPNPWARVLSRLFFNPQEFLESYADQLQAALQSSRLPD